MAEQAGEPRLADAPVRSPAAAAMLQAALASTTLAALATLAAPPLPLASSASPPKGKGSQYSITERRVPELIPVLGSQPAGDVSHKPDGRLPLFSARPAVTPQPLTGLLPILLLGEQRHIGSEQFA